MSSLSVQTNKQNSKKLVFEKSNREGKKERKSFLTHQKSFSKICMQNQMQEYAKE